MPHADRPWMPGYGVEPPKPKELLAWRWAEERLAASWRYWVAVTRPDGSPHLSAVWGVWLQSAFWFGCSGRSVKARALTADPRIAVSTEGAEEAITVSGRAKQVSGSVLGEVFAAYQAKYQYNPSGAAEPFWRVEPATVIAVIDRPGEFSSRATRWTF